MMPSREGVLNAGLSVTTSPAQPKSRRNQRSFRPAGWAIVVASVIATTAWVLWTPVSRPAPEARSTPDVPTKDGDVIRFSRTFAERARLGTALATPRTISPLVRAIGAATFDLRHHATVAAPLPGRIRHTFKLAGEDVGAGEALADLESVEIGRAQADVLAARARERAFLAWLKRERRGVEGRSGILRVEEATAAYESSRGDRIAAERTVAALGGEPQGEPGILVLRTPIAGRVISAKVARGQPIKPSDALFEVADLRKIAAELDVLERDLAKVRVGDLVTIVAQTDNGHRIVGKVATIGDVIDRDARTASVRVAVDNQTGVLRPGQSITAQIAGSSPQATPVTVPLQAVNRIDGQAAVFVVLDEGTVRLREITTGAEDAANVAVVEGLSAGERVISNGAFAIKAGVFF